MLDWCQSRDSSRLHVRAPVCMLQTCQLWDWVSNDLMHLSPGRRLWQGCDTLQDVVEWLDRALSNIALIARYQVEWMRRAADTHTHTFTHARTCQIAQKGSSDTGTALLTAAAANNVPQVGHTNSAICWMRLRSWIDYLEACRCEEKSHGWDAIQILAYACLSLCILHPICMVLMVAETWGGCLPGLPLCSLLSQQASGCSRSGRWSWQT